MSCTHLDLSPQRRARFNALRDVLIPAGEGMPSASDADPTGEWASRVLTVRPDLRKSLEQLLDQIRTADLEADIERLKTEESERFEKVARDMAAAYLINPWIHDLLGYSGQKSRPPSPGEADSYLDGGSLLEPVRKWKPRYELQAPASERQGQ